VFIEIKRSNRTWLKDLQQIFDDGMNALEKTLALLKDMFST